MSHSGAVRRCCRLSLSRLLTVTVVSAGGLLVAPAALAAEPAPVFGRPGQIVLPELMGVRSGVPGMFAGLGLGGLSVAAVGGEIGWGGVVGYAESSGKQENVYSGGYQAVAGQTRSFWAAPSVDIFAARGISIGVSVGYLYASQRVSVMPANDRWGFEGFAVAASPRIGYVVPIARGLSFWPRLSVSAAYSEQAVAAGSRAEGRGRSLSGGLDLALVYQPIQRLMFKVSPQIGAGVSQSASQGESQSATVESTFLRVGGEATVGLVF